MNAQTGFWFPSMKVGEISRALEEWGLRVSEDQVQRPTGDIVQSIYILFVQLSTGLTPESLEEPANRALAGISDFPELYQNPLSMNMLLHHVQRLAHAARVQDISIRDLVFPEPERTRNILSAIINFIKFAEERGGFLKNLRDQSTSAIEERDVMRQQVAELRQKVIERRKQLEVDAPRVRELELEVEKIRGSLANFNVVKENMNREVHNLKKERDNLVRQKENIGRDIGHVTSQINVTRSRIVQSPDRIRKYISEMGIQARDERQIIVAAETKARELKAKLDALNLFEQDMKKLIDDLRAIQVEKSQVDAIKNKLELYREELERKVVQHEQLMGRAERAKRQENNAEEKLRRAIQHAEERRARAQDELARLQRDYAEMSEERKENDRITEETKAEAAELERKMKEHLRQNQVEINELLNEYWKLRMQIEVYMETLGSKLSINVGQ